MRKITFLAVLIIIIVVTMTRFGSLVENVSAADGKGAEFEAVTAVLNQIESGRSALVQMEQYEVEVKFETGRGTYYRALNNRMVIDGSQGAERAALSFIHEMTHVRYHHEGLRVDAGGTDQDLYVQGRLEEETEGVVSSIEAKKELAEAGIDISQVRYPLETAYTEAYQTAQHAARVRERDITPAELESIGRNAGTARVLEGFVEGEVLSSRSLLTYTENYGDCWDDAHRVVGLATIIGQVMPTEAAGKLLQSANDHVYDIC